MPSLSTLWLHTTSRSAHGWGRAFRTGGPRPAGPVPRDDGAAPAGDDRPGRGAAGLPLAGRPPLADLPQPASRMAFAGHPRPVGRLPAAGRLLPMGI